MAKKYMSEHTRAKHSYKFFKERRNDPEWQEEFYEVRRLHWRSIFIKSIITVVLVIVFGIMHHYTFTIATPVIVKKNRLHLRRLVAPSLIVLARPYKSNTRLIRKATHQYQASHHQVAL